MSADVVARGLAVAAGRKSGVSAFAFADIAGQAIPAGVGAVAVTVGAWPAIALSDARATAALAAAHPRFCKADAGGRYFRLVAEHGAISVEQGGATGTPGTNDRPAFQATINYAHAVGIGRVALFQAAYELWTPARTSGPFDLSGEDGHCLVIRGGLTFEGVGRKPVLSRKGPAGATLTAKTVTVIGPTTYYWRGGGLYLAHDGSFDANSRTVLRNFVFDGGLDRTASHTVYDANDNNSDGWDTTDKGIWAQDMVTGDLVMEDVEIRRFRGELFYWNGYAGSRLYARRCHFHTTNGDADNSFQGYAEWDDCKFGNAFQAAESGGGYGHWYRRCLFYDTLAMSFGGGGSGTPVYNYAFPVRDPDLPPPWTTFEDCEMIGPCDVRIWSWTRGTIKTVSAQVSIEGQRLTDIDLEIEALCDGGGGITAVSLIGPLSLTDAIPGAPGGNYNEPIQRTRVHVRSATRTKQAAAGVHKFSDIFSVRGYVDPASVVLSAGPAIDCERFFRGYLGSFAETPRVPLIVKPRGVRQIFDTAYGDKFVTVSADLTIEAGFVDYVLHNPSGGARTVGIADTMVHARGQRIRFTVFEYNPANGPITFPKNGTGLMLAADRILLRGGEWLELEWNPEAARWLEAGYFGQGAA